MWHIDICDVGCLLILMNPQEVSLLFRLKESKSVRVGPVCQHNVGPGIALWSRSIEQVVLLEVWYLGRKGWSITDPRWSDICHLMLDTELACQAFIIPSLKAVLSMEQSAQLQPPQSIL